MNLNKINVSQKFSLFDDYWTPKVLAESNEQLVKIAKGQGKLMWHSHDNEDELFIVFKGCLKLHLRDDTGDTQLMELEPGELFVVPKGMEHCPEADHETHFMMLEPKSTQHTGVHQTENTVAVTDQKWI